VGKGSKKKKRRGGDTLASRQNFTEERCAENSWTSEEIVIIGKKEKTNVAL